MSDKINERPIYDGQSYYWNKAVEPLSAAAGPNTEVDILRRLQMELAYKPYFIWDDLVTYLDENGLNYLDIYDKNIHYVKLLKTVISILNALSNNIDLYMKVEMNFGSRSEAYSNIQKRVSDIKKQIKDIEKESGNQRSDFSFMLYTRELSHDE